MRKNVLGRSLALLLMTSISACATAPSESIACPDLETYTTGDQIKAADELGTLPSGSMLEVFVRDYSRLRDQVRIICPPASASGGLY